MLPSASASPRPGEIVRVRQRRYLVEEVDPPASAGDCTLVRLACVDDDAQGQPLEVLWEVELDAEILGGETWEQIATRGFDPPRLFSAYLHTLRWNCVTATDPNLFQAPFRAGIHLEAYQLEPLRKALLLPRVNLFIADDVGLGKTIEAGLIARELLIRKKVRDIVVACPPSVLPQWQDELETRFGLTFEVLDRDYIARIRRERGYGVNPWTTHSRFLVSHRLLIDETYTGPLRDWLGRMRASSLLILDEAHHAAPASGQRYAIDSRITRAIRDLAPRFEHRLFLSATPHNGHSSSFSALLEILDPQRFCRGVPVKGKDALGAVMVRRLKEDIRSTGTTGFAQRVVRQIDLDGLAPDEPELRLSVLLDRYRRLREERMSGESKRKQAAAGLLVCGLQQRLLSSVAAFARTLRVHRRTVERLEREAAGKAVPEVGLGLLDLITEAPGSDDDRAALSEEELAHEEDAQVETATLAAGGIPREEADLLDEMDRIAQQARGQPDARVRYLIGWIRENMCRGLPGPGEEPAEPPAWNDLRLLVFTEYEDTLRYLRQQLEGTIEGTDRAGDRIEVYHGPTPQATREEIKQAFNSDPTRHPVRILLATDAAREGINLQLSCWNLFHFDVPWNPARLEQRNGRIDRKLQPKDRVYCHYFVYRQRAEDRVLRALVRKTDTIKTELGSLAQVVEGRLAETLKHGIRHDQANALAKVIDGTDLDSGVKGTVQEELEPAREPPKELVKQIGKLRDLIETSGNWVGYDEAPFRDALSCALELMQAGSLQPVDGANRYRMPALHERLGADPTWADTLDTLRAPRKKEQAFWEWRRLSPLRPVVFEDTGRMGDDVVHLHLEHRLVQRLLGRFAAQGFVHHDLSRACLAITDPGKPRVVLLGRLSLYGAGAARLHEELIRVTAFWYDPVDVDRRPLEPLGETGESTTLERLEKALLPSGQRGADSGVLKLCQATAPQDIRELLPHLQKRGEEMAAEAGKRLASRGDKEAADMRAILEKQRQAIADTEKKTEAAAPTLLDLIEDEKRQLEANRRHWRSRLEALEDELQTEPERIREVYRVKATRIEPVGLVYLWPVTG